MVDLKKNSKIISFVLFLGSREPSPSVFLIAEFTVMCHIAQLLYFILMKETVSTK